MPSETQGVVRLVRARLLRLLWLLPAAAILTFTLASLAPVDPVEAYVGARTMLVGPEQRALIAAQWGLDAPAPERFLRWASNLLQGDFGVSTIYRQPVAEVIAERFWASLQLLAVAWLMGGLLGFLLGVLAGVYAGSAFDNVVRTSAVVLAATPTFWVAILLVFVFAVALGWAPVCCQLPPGTLPGEATLAGRLHHLVLPAVAVALGGMAPLILHTRQKQIAVLEEEPARLLRAYGASRLWIALGPGLRHVAAPALMLHFASVGELFGGSILAETVFAWPGLGRAIVEAGLRQDVPLLLAAALFTVLFVFVGNLLADVALRLIDPRTRAEDALP